MIIEAGDFRCNRWVLSSSAAKRNSAMREEGDKRSIKTRLARLKTAGCAIDLSHATAKGEKRGQCGEQSGGSGSGK